MTATTLHTRDTLAVQLRTLGVQPGSVVLVHSSMRSLGSVCGGTVTLVEAFRDVLGPDGTLVVPTHTPANSDPAEWQHPPVPASWWPVIREKSPAFDPAITPSRWMGAFAEQVRTWPGACRSDHPQVSFAALGARAEKITAGHALDQMLGERSPLARVYELDGDVLLLGVGHGSNTSLHLAEYRVPEPTKVRKGAAVRTPDGGRAWVWWDDVDEDESDFVLLGADLEETGAVRIGRVGDAEARLMSQRAAVDFAVPWLQANRSLGDGT